MSDWSPYLIGPAPRPRPLQTEAGLGDRLRYVAFAERQAARAFGEAPGRFPEAPTGLAEAWRWVALEEMKHEQWLLTRLEELGQPVAGIPVTLDLYQSFTRCSSAKEFSDYMARAEEWGRVAGERFAEVLRARDPRTADLFAQIAREEREHIAMVARFFKV